MPMPFMPFMPHRRPYTMFAPPCPCTPPGPPPEPHTPRPRTAPWGAVSVADALRGISSHLAELDETLAGMPKVITVNGAPLEPVEGVVALSLVDSAVLDGGYLRFKAGDAVLFSVDASPFVKDGMVDAVGVADGNLVVTFNTDSGKQPVSIPLTEIFDPDDYYDKAAVDGLLSGKRDKTDLSVDQGKWLLVKPDGTLVWMVSRGDPDDWVGDDELEPHLNRGSGPLGEAWVFEIGPQASGERARLEIPYSEVPIDSAVVVFNLETSTYFDGVYRLVRGSRFALDTEIPPAQVNADWNAVSGPARILNKPTIPTVPTPVAPSTAAAAQGKPADAKATGDALEQKRGKDDLVVYDPYSVWSGDGRELAYNTGGGYWEYWSSGTKGSRRLSFSDGIWTLYDVRNTLPPRLTEIGTVLAPANAISLNFGDSGAFTRMFVPVSPADTLAKTSQIPDISGKADAADLRYRIAEAGFKYQFAASAFPITFMNTISSTAVAITAGDAGDITWVVQLGGGAYVLYNGFDFAYFSSTGDYGGSQPGVDLQFNGVAAANAGEPLVKTLADRTVNLITATTETSIDIELPGPVAVDGVRYCRDFIVRLTLTTTTSISFIPITGETITWDSSGDPSGTFQAGTHLLRFTEVAPGVFHGGGSVDPAQLATKLDSTSAAPAFSTSSTYAVDDHVTYNGGLYRCTTAVTTAGAWTGDTNWTADTMTDPDAVLDITAQNQLRVVAKDGTVLWAQGYDLASTSSATLACDAVNNFTFADGATTQAFTLPTAPTGKVGDFGLDIDNSANTGAATLTLTGLDTTFSVVVPEGESLNDMLAIAAGELARFYVTLSTFRVNNLPTWHIVKQVVENGGAQS